ncbi:MAG: hypothetical protein HFG02_00920 [Oscillibacter sp.]|nr:hypothetical protein [Oscillibacter sp.]
MPISKNTPANRLILKSVSCSRLAQAAISPVLPHCFRQSSAMLRLDWTVALSSSQMAIRSMGQSTSFVVTKYYKAVLGPIVMKCLLDVMNCFETGTPKHPEKKETNTSHFLIDTQTVK